jgi:DNA/RNA endonuclease YhcR with UshA esterase domain
MKTKLLVLVVTVFAVAGPTFAHHGTAAYDMKDPVTVTGTVTDFEFVNPHCQVYLEVKNDKGETEQWQGELTAPTKLARGGWTKRTLKPGDTVTVSGPVTKSGKHSIWIRNMIGPDGQPLHLGEE